MSTQQSNLVINLGGGLSIETHDCRKQISVTGKSRTDKQMTVLKEAGLTDNTIAYVSTKKGKLGTEARGQLAEHKIRTAAYAAAQGNYTLMYEIIVVESAKQVQPIRSREDYERVRGFISGLRDNLKNGGYTSNGKMTTECVALENCLMLFKACDAATEARKKIDAERRLREDIERAKTRREEIQDMVDRGLMANKEADVELGAIEVFLSEAEAQLPAEEVA